MSVYRKDFVIYGYDLSKHRDTIARYYEETANKTEVDAFDKLRYGCNKPETYRYFDDPMSGKYAFFGVVAASHDEFEDLKPVCLDLHRLDHWAIYSSLVENFGHLFDCSEYAGNLKLCYFTEYS